jgi:hypothetical protein
MGLLEVLLYAVGYVLGWPLRSFGRWLHRHPHWDASQITTLHKAGRLALGAAICLVLLAPLAWLIWK